MPILDNPRHQALAQVLAGGATADGALLRPLRPYLGRPTVEGRRSAIRLEGYNHSAEIIIDAK